MVRIAAPHSIWNADAGDEVPWDKKGDWVGVNFAGLKEIWGRLVYTYFNFRKVEACLSAVVHDFHISTPHLQGPTFKEVMS